LPCSGSSGHDIAEAFGKDNGGAIPSNLLQISNTESNSHYLRACKMLNREGHPARFPVELPRFFIQFLTDPGDIVVDIFSGSNTTGMAAEELGRRWLAVELDRSYATLSAVRFMEGWEEDRLRSVVKDLDNGHLLTIHTDSRNVLEAEGDGVRLSDKSPLMESQRMMFLD